MKLSTFIKNLQELKRLGHGDLEVYYRHGASGDCGKLRSAWVTDEKEDTGPFDINGNYIAIFAGN